MVVYMVLMFSLNAWKFISKLSENVISFISYLPYFRKRTEQLLNSGNAYKCYCTEKRLELLRRDALRTRTVPRYDNKCRSLDEEELKKNEGKKYCIRFKVFILIYAIWSFITYH